jgi:hypothetical protein
MRSPIFDKDDPTDKRVDKLETFVGRIIRRSNVSHQAAMITPFPISNAVFGDDVRGPVLLYMFCCEGEITKGFVYTSMKLKNGLKLSIAINNSLGGESKEFIMDSKGLTLSPEMKVKAGDRLTVSIEPMSEKEIVNEFWIALMWTPSVKEVDVKKLFTSIVDEPEEETV